MVHDPVTSLRSPTLVTTQSEDDVGGRGNGGPTIAPSRGRVVVVVILSHVHFTRDLERTTLFRTTPPTLCRPVDSGLVATISCLDRRATTTTTTGGACVPRQRRRQQQRQCGIVVATPTGSPFDAGLPGRDFVAHFLSRHDHHGDSPPTPP